MFTGAIQHNTIKGFILAAALLATANLAWAGGGGTADAVGGTAPIAVAAPAPAQESQSLSTLRIEEPKPAKAESPKFVEESPSRGKWIALAAAEHSAAAFDAYTTRQAIGRGAVEADPMMRPFANSPGLYAAIQVCPLILDYTARRMQRSQNAFVRKMWWLPQTTGTAMYLFSGAHNMGVPARP